MSSMTKVEELHAVDTKLELLKRTFAKGLTNDELDLFRYVCKHTGLDPFIKQIYPVKRKNKGEEVMIIQVGIDGLRSIAERTGNYSPGREPTYHYDENKNLVSATAYVKKRTPDGSWHEVSATAFWNEYKPAYENHFWKNMPHLMLAKCAESLAIRRAFPAQTATVYTPEEMAQADLSTVKTAQEVYKPEVESQPVPFSQDLFDLKKMLADQGVSTLRLDEWIKLRAETKGQPVEAIIQACLRKGTFAQFKDAFTKWSSDSEMAV